MSKLSFRARALDATKPLPVYRGKDMPDLNDCVSINRAVPQMPTGMEKEEESVGNPFVRHWLFTKALTPAGLRRARCALPVLRHAGEVDGVVGGSRHACGVRDLRHCGVGRPA